jgi:SAM-dependent methyltransferase
VHDPLFDLSAEYEQMLNQGIRLSGEDRHFFLTGRVQYLRSILPSDFRPKRILDYGCGIGDTSLYLAQQFPGAEVVGVDEAENALQHARAHFGSERLRFEMVANLERNEAFHLVYVNGVFHHIPAVERAGALRFIYSVMVPGGKLALFENNPWNLGARMVMKRIPFDRDAIMISPREAARLLAAAGFRMAGSVRSLFYFPRQLAFLRRTEGVLAHLPLGAQYCALAQKIH